MSCLIAKVFISLTIINGILCLKCLSNYCSVDQNGKGERCMVEGDGLHEDCGNSTGQYEVACYETPISAESGQVESRGCVNLYKHFDKKDEGCSKENGYFAKGFSTYACICFQDFCNNRFNNTLPSKFRVENGYPVQKSDGVPVHLFASEDEEKFNHRIK